MDAYGFSQDDHKRVGEATRDYEARSKSGSLERPGQRAPRGGEVVEGFYDEDLIESRNQGQAPTRALFTVWRGMGAEWRRTTEQYTAVNRDDDFSASQGDFGLWRQISGEWRPVSAGQCDFVRAVLDEELTSLGTAEASIQAYDAEYDFWCTTPDKITVLDGLGLGETLAECTPVYAHEHCQSGLWLVIAAPCDGTCVCNVMTESGECVITAGGEAVVLECV